MRESWLYITDNTNIRWVRVFQLYKGFFRRSTLPGFFVKGSARVVEPPRIEYKGFKYKYSLKGDIARLFIARARFRALYNDGATVKFSDNSAIIIKKKQDPKSKFINGPCSRRLLRRKFISTFKKVL
jgi:ribosomal protein L14